MNNPVFERLLSLMDSVGLAGEENSVERAEICAYSEAVFGIFNMLEQGINEIFSDTMGEKGVKMYCSLMNIDVTGNTEELKSKITERLSNGFYQLKASEFDSAAENTPGLVRVDTLEEPVWEISPINSDTLSAFSDFSDDYYPVIYRPNFEGGGMTFDFIDSMELRWYQIDGFKIPFWILDKLKDPENAGRFRRAASPQAAAPS